MMKFYSKTLLLSSLIASSSITNIQAAKLMDAIQNAKIEGFAFGRISTLHGRDAAGTRYQLRFKPTITTGEVAGWSGSVGIFFSKGTSTPDNNYTDTEISASRGDQFFSASDRFNIGDFYITYNAKEQLNTKTTLRAGQQSPKTPFNDTNLDRALGIFIDNKDISWLNMGFQWWDSWVGDDMYISRATYVVPNATNFASTIGSGVGNNVFMVSFTSDADFTQKTGVSYNLWYTYIHKFAPYMIFADLSYTAKFSNHSLSILGQVSATGLTDNPILEGDAQFATLFRSAAGDTWAAKNRGMYNIRLDYRYNFVATSGDDEPSKPIGFFGLSLGFLGSFGDGYGTLIDNTGGLKPGGGLWNSFSGAEANGFGILGVGGFRNSSIISPYIKLEAGYKKFGFALDIAYVETTHFYFLKKAGTDGNLNTVSNWLYGNGNKVAAAQLVDISPTISYKFTDSVSMTAFYGYLIGNPSMGRFRFLVTYVF